jgi:RNA polymerase sigma-70 factor (ECF subfamily)
MGSPPQHEDLSTEELFRRFAPFVARFLYRLGVRSDGLDDLIQEVFLVVHRRGGYKAGPAKPTSYLATIAANAASAYRRKQRIEQARSSDTEVEGLMSSNEGPVQVMEVAERLRLLQAALDRLEPDFRSTLILADIEGESCASIAAASGIPTGTVYWRLHEARKRFQRALRAELRGLPARPSHAPATEVSESRGRASALALAVAPFWFFSGTRRLLRKGAVEPPVQYDVTIGLEQHRQLVQSAPVASWAPPVIPTNGLGHSSMGMVAASAGVAAAVVAVVGLMRSTAPASPGDTALPADAPTKTVGSVATPAKAASSVSKPTLLRDRNEHAGTPLPRAPEPSPDSATAPRGSDPSASAGALVPTASTQGALASAPSTPSRPHDEMNKPPEAPRPNETSRAPTDTQVEAREIARAERMLSLDPAAALAVVREARTRFRPSFLPEERDYVEVMALQALGRSADAKAAASRFLTAYPGGAFSHRVRGVVSK